MGSNSSRTYGTSPVLTKFVGYMPKELQSNYNNLGKHAIGMLRSVRNSFMSLLYEIDTHWASPEAVAFSSVAADRMNKEVKKACDDLVYIINEIKYAAEKWNNVTGFNLAFPSQESSFRSELISIKSNAKETINGVVGVDYDALYNLSTSKGIFKYGEIGVKDIDGNFEASVQYFNGLVGANQAAALQECYNLISKRFAARVSELDAELNRMIKDVANKYRDTAGEIGTLFSQIS